MASFASFYILIILGVSLSACLSVWSPLFRSECSSRTRFVGGSVCLMSVCNILTSPHKFSSAPSAIQLLSRKCRLQMLMFRIAIISTNVIIMKIKIGFASFTECVTKSKTIYFRIRANILIIAVARAGEPANFLRLRLLIFSLSGSGFWYFFFLGLRLQGAKKTAPAPGHWLSLAKYSFPR